MALLRAQQKHKSRTKQNGSFARFLIFSILLVAITAVPLLLLRAQSRRFDQTVADLDDGEDEGIGAGEEAGPAFLPAVEEPGEDFSLDEELAKIDAQLEEIRQRRQEMEEAPYLPKISSSVDANGAAEEVEEEALPKELLLPQIDKPKDLHKAWELLINYATRSLDECGQGCKTCAVSVGTANIKLDTELMKSGEMPTISALQAGNETERKVESVAREINRCAVQAAAAAARTRAFGIKAAKPISEAALRRRKREQGLRDAETRFHKSMHEMDEAEEAARQQERLRQELQAKMEEAEQEFKELHELANPIWYDLETLREKALEVCTVKAQQIATERHHKQAQELTSSSAAKEMEALTRDCIKDFVASREKVKREAESFQAKASHRKDKDLKADAQAAKRKRDNFRLAGVEEIAQLQIDSVKKDALHMTYQDLKKGGMAFFSGNVEKMPGQKEPGRGKKGGMKPRQPSDRK